VASSRPVVNRHRAILRGNVSSKAIAMTTIKAISVNANR
jgi:hypothetical protein